MDPFEKPGDVLEPGAWALGLSEKFGIPIQPVHVLSGGALAFSPDMHAAWLMQVALQAEDKIRQMIDRLKLPHVLPPIVLSEIYSSRSEAVSALVEFAKENDAQVLVLQRLSRRGHKGKIGGFAETLLLKSDVPVLMVGKGARKALPKGKFPRKTPRKILLAVDLSGDFVALVDQVASWAKRMNSSIHLYHAVAPFPATGYRPTADISPGDWSGPVAATSLSAWRGDIDARKKQMEKLAKSVERRGVSCTFEVDSVSVRAVDGIFRSQRRAHADWIALAGKSGRWSALVLGSVSRVIAREASCPVWIVRAERYEKALKSAARRTKAA